MYRANLDYNVSALSLYSYAEGRAASALEAAGAARREVSHTREIVLAIKATSTPLRPTDRPLLPSVLAHEHG